MSAALPEFRLPPLWGLLWALLCLCVLTPTSPPALAAEAPITLSYLYSDGNAPGTLVAYRSLLEQHPELEGRIQLQLVTESLLDTVDSAAVARSDVLVLDMMNQQMMETYNSTHGQDLVRDIAARGAVLLVGAGLQPVEYFTDMGAHYNERAMAYWQQGGSSNQLALMKYALTLAGIQGLELPALEPGLESGYYYPDASGGQVFADWDSFDLWRRQQGLAVEGRPQVAIGFYRAAFYGNETDVVDALVAEVERQGAAAIPLFGFPGHLAYQQLLLDENGESRADVILSLLLRFADFDAAATLATVDVPLINLITLYGRSEQEWRDSDNGLSLFEGTFQVAVPELAGLISPVVVGSRERVQDPATGISVVVNQPIHSRIEMAVQRGLRYVHLLHTPNADKRVALMYYNYPAGKANIGASYLNIAESLAMMLERLRAEGYQLGDSDISADAILADISNRARNIGGYAPGELEEMVAAGGTALVSVQDYRRWLDALDPTLRDKIISDWGQPEDSQLMALTQAGENFIVVPRLEYGNITLLPQPARAWGEDVDKMYHASNLAPHHQYVATYAWLREQQQVDAVVHIGTHGTHEWLDGKDMGQTRADASDALIADLPNLYIYNVDVVGEGLVARRRGLATLIDHMVPSFIKADLYPELAALRESLDDYHRNLYQNLQLAERYAGSIIEQLVRHGIDRSLGFELNPADPTSLTHDNVHEIENYLLELREQFIPYGMHAFGRLPAADARASTVDAIVSVDRSLLPDQITVMAQDMEQRIIDSAAQELDSLLHALSGGYIGGGPGGEPIRNPNVYPTGKNFYGIDPSKIPKKAAWELGVQLADQMLAQHLAQHGEYPKKVSFVIWGDETMRHEGILESQIFHLLGTRPVWDERDTVVGVEVVPAQQLGRPRVDILIASAAEGMFSNLTQLLDEAVQKVKVLEETQNFVRDHYLQTRAALIGMGYSEEDADRRAGVRIFDEPPGTFNLNTSMIAGASGTWDSDLGMANEYINKMGHGFGNGFWGEPMQDTFRLALQGVEKVVHSSSTMLYGALDNDDFFMYMGGLASAVRAVDGATPDMVVTNTRNPSRPEMTSIEAFIGTELRSRYINPEWIEGMQAEGYAGARAMSEFVEYLWGWDATAPEVVEDFMWQQTFEVYVQDKHDLDMQAFFDQASPYAFQDMAARMLETIRKQYWQADQAVTQELLQAYVDSVSRNGLSCSDVTCGNARLMEYILEQGAAMELNGVDLAQLREALEAALRNNVETLAQRQRDFVQRNDARIAQEFANAQGSGVDTDASLQGFRMEQIERSAAPASAPAALSDQFSENLALWYQALLVLVLLGWWWRRRRQSVKIGE